jgi:anti-anti-sigma factor
MEKQMELQVSHESGYILGNTSGPIDGSAGELFREYLHPLIGQAGTKLVLDLSKSDRINSAGIGELVLLVSHANTNSSRVILAACVPFVSIVFSRSGLDRFFERTDTVAEAISRILDQ